MQFNENRTFKLINKKLMKNSNLYYYLIVYTTKFNFEAKCVPKLIKQFCVFFII